MTLKVKRSDDSIAWKSRSLVACIEFLAKREPRCDGLEQKLKNHNASFFSSTGEVWLEKHPREVTRYKTRPGSKAFGSLKLSIIDGVVQCRTDHVATVRVIRDCQSIYNSAGFSSVNSTCPRSSASSSTFSFFDFLGANHSARKPL